MKKQIQSLEYYREREMTHRKAGKFDIANEYRELADIIERTGRTDCEILTCEVSCLGHVIPFKDYLV